VNRKPSTKILQREQSLTPLTSTPSRIPGNVSLNITHLHPHNLLDLVNDHHLPHIALPSLEPITSHSPPHAPHLLPQSYLVAILKNEILLHYLYAANVAPKIPPTFGKPALQ
jgi:hypothetical protein